MKHNILLIIIVITFCADIYAGAETATLGLDDEKVITVEKDYSTDFEGYHLYSAAISKNDQTAMLIRERGSNVWVVSLYEKSGAKRYSYRIVLSDEFSKGLYAQNYVYFDNAGKLNVLFGNKWSSSIFISLSEHIIKVKYKNVGSLWLEANISGTSFSYKTENDVGLKTCCQNGSTVEFTSVHTYCLSVGSENEGCQYTLFYSEREYKYCKLMEYVKPAIIITQFAAVMYLLIKYKVLKNKNMNRELI